MRFFPNGALNLQSSRHTSEVGGPSTASPAASRNNEGADARGGISAPTHVLVHVCRMVGGALDLGMTLRAAMRATAEALAAEACSILLYDKTSNTLSFHVVHGDRSDSLANESLPVGDGSIAGWVAGHRVLLSIPDAHADPRFNPEYDRRTGFRTHSVLCAPMLVQDRLVGVVQVLNHRDGRPFDAADGELLEAVAAVVALAVDDAAQHEARIKAERLAAVGQAIAGMAHFIKNILNGLEGGAYLVEREFRRMEAGDKFSRGWGMVSRNLRVLRDVVLDMLTYSKPRRPRLELTDVRTVCEDIVELTEIQARDAGVALELHVDEQVGKAWFDPTAIRRCLLNLVGNAIDACRKHGDRVSLRVAASAPDRYAISVSDNGCGMPEHVVRRIFEPLFSTKGSRGTGLGLAVTRKVVEEHGGSLSVESVEGRGTTFVMELPVGGPPGGKGE